MIRNGLIHLVLILAFASFQVNAKGKVKMVSSKKEIIDITASLSSGDTLLVEEGTYKDLNWVIRAQGTFRTPVVIKAKKGGKVKITGNSHVELRGRYIVFDGFLFCNGARDPKQWRSHGPGLIAIYGSFNRITNCKVDNFDQANSAYITTSLNEKGEVPLYCRIDHCSFTNKKTLDQVINLNNRIHQRSKESAPAMYHRIDHCYFNNPFKKSGNAGGGIRIGYYRNDVGRCVVDSNLFVSHNSEPEIITSKCRENFFYANTFVDCRGTLNFRHGDRQVMINNFFLTKNEKQGCGGAFIWGSEHLIACNYFQLGSLIKERGNAALYINPGAEDVEHALGFNLSIVNNMFVNNNGLAIHFEPLRARREAGCVKRNYTFALPYDLKIKGNIFYQDKFLNSPFFYTSQTPNQLGVFSENFFYGASTGFGTNPPGMTQRKMRLKKNKHGIYQRPKKFSYVLSKPMTIEGLDWDFSKLASEGIKGSPLNESEVGPKW